MTLDPDPAELAPSRDPAAYGKKPLFGLAFWLMMILCLAFMAGGYALARFGPQFFPVRSSQAGETPKTQAASAAAPAAAPPRPGLTLLRPSAPAAGGPATVAAAPQDASLDARVQRLESAEDAVVSASAAALAAAQLSQAAETSRPFPEEYAAVQALMPASPDVQALAPHAAA